MHRACALALRLGLWLIITASAVPAAGAVDLPADERQYLAGLRERRLYSLADAYCKQQLEGRQRPVDEQAALTVERMRVLGEQALEAPADQRARAWAAAHEVAEQWRSALGDNEHGVLVDAQSALLLVWEGELLRQQAEVARGSQPDYSAALEALRRAESALETVSQRVEQGLLEQRTADAEGLTREEWFSLRNHLNLEFARLLVARGRCYPAASADQIAAASQAVELLRGIQTELPAEDPLVAETHVEELIAQRLLSSREEQQRILALLEASSSPELEPRIRAEKIRTALALGQVERALSWSATAVPPRAAGAADLDLARFEASLAAWRTAAAGGRDGDAQAARQRSLDLAREIERVHGSYWGRRADALLVRSSSGSGAQADLEILRRRADDQYLRGDLAAAVATYDATAQAAREAAAADDEFLARYRAALIRQKQGDHGDVLARLRALGRELPEHREAAAAHFEAVKTAARLARSDPETMGTYVELLTEHTTMWPSAATAATARLWLGQFYRYERQYADAIAAYAAVPPTAAEAADAVAGLAAAWAARLAATDAPETLAGLVNEARGTLSAFVSASGAAPAARRAGAVATARLTLQYAPQDLTLATPLLDEALALPADPGDAAHGEVAAWRAIAAALDPAQPATAGRLDAALAPLSAQQIGDMAELLAGILPTTNQAQLRRRAGDLQLALLDRLDPQQKSLRYLRWRADAFAATGGREQAVELFTRLIKAQPRDAGLQVALAELLESGSSPADQRAALEQWRRVAQRAKPQSDSWYRAKLGVAETLLRLGDATSRREAEELIRWMQLATPLATTPWQARFDALR